MLGEIVNRVEQSGIITFDLKDFYPPFEVVVYDLKEDLFMEMILKEKDFREKVKNTDWSVYKGKGVAVLCSNDAIIPLWAYMILLSHLKEIASLTVVGSKEGVISTHYESVLAAHDWTQYQDKRVVLKGCSDVEIPLKIYGLATNYLLPHVKSLMFGEPCSTVPVYKAKKSNA